MMLSNNFFLYILVIFLAACSSPQHYDIIIKNGLVYDGSGNAPVQTDVAIVGDAIAKVGDLKNDQANQIIDAAGKAVTPGFINMLSWAAYPLLEDGRSMSDIKQGVTLEVFGEGSSLGPLNKKMRENAKVSWTTLAEGLDSLARKGVTPNIASFVGATTLRIHEIGYEDRPPTHVELAAMQALVRQAMEEGALGVGSSLIYAPAFYAKTEELIALAKVAAVYDGMYISHMRSEGDSFVEAVDELLRIATEADIDAEIYHLKAAGKDNWHKLPVVLAKIDSANKTGSRIAADMYNYTAASTGLDATMPPWVQEGGTAAWIKRLKNPVIKRKVLKEMRSPSKNWENFFTAAGNPENILLVEFHQDSLKYLTGKTVAEIAALRKTSPEETIVDMVIQNNGDISAVYFLMNDENVKKQLKLPYITFCSDARSIAAEGKNLLSSTHPRTYGNFARLLAKYVREEKVISLEDAIHKLTHLSAQKLKIKKRGKLEPGYYADILVFDPEKIQDKATFNEPHQYAEGMEQVFVNGVQVLKDGSHTGAMPGRVVHGPGYQQTKGQ